MKSSCFPEYAPLIIFFLFFSNYCHFTVCLKCSANIPAFGFSLPSPRNLHTLITDWLYLPDRLGRRPIDALPDSIIWTITSFFQNFWQIILRMLYAYKVNVLALQCPKFKYSSGASSLSVGPCFVTLTIS